MAQDATEIVVGANGNIYTAPAEATISWPTNVATALDSDFVQVGFTSEDGVTFTDSREITDIPVWQALYPARKLVASKTSTIEFVCRQYNRDTVSLAYGGGSVDVAGGVATYTPPMPEEIDTRALIVEWEDDDYTFRLVAPRGIVTGDVATNVTRTAAADLPISYEVTPLGQPVDGDPETYPFYLLTDHPSLVSGS